MNKGDKAIVINDCEVKAGSEVEVGKISRMEMCADDSFEYRMGTYSTHPRENIYNCYFNGIRVEIAESDLKPVPKERWKPDLQKPYFFVNSMIEPAQIQWEGTSLDVARKCLNNVFRTKEECQKMCDKIKKLLTEDNG